MDRRPYYFFSDRPYTVKDARAWKRRSLFSSGFLTIICLLVLFAGDMSVLESAMIPAVILLLVMLASSIIRTIALLITDPKNDPMLQSFQCPADHPKPPSDICKYCGGKYARGVHSVCPHCKAGINDACN